MRPLKKFCFTLIAVCLSAYLYISNSEKYSTNILNIQQGNLYLANQLPLTIGKTYSVSLPEEPLLQHKNLLVTSTGALAGKYPTYLIEYIEDKQKKNICASQTGVSNNALFTLVHSDKHANLTIGLHYRATCLSGAIGKCYNAGFDPLDNINQFQTCTRMFRADYCGDGRSFTVAGKMITFFRKPHFDSPPPNRTLLEAVWGPQGALCVANTRVKAKLSISEIHNTCNRPINISENCRVAEGEKSDLLVSFVHTKT